MLGKAKVMSYEDLEEAREKRRKKDISKEARAGKRCGSQRVAVQEVNEPDPMIQEDGQIESIPWQAPVARMW